MSDMVFLGCPVGRWVRIGRKPWEGRWVRIEPWEAAYLRFRPNSLVG